MTPRQDIAVAGCGPAGLTAALLLHRAGHRVTLFERFEKPRPIGSGLMIQPTGQAVLNALGLFEPLAAYGVPVSRIYGEAVGSGRAVLDIRYEALKNGGARGIGLHRNALFSMLYDAVAAEGIAIELGRAIASSALSAGDRRRLVFEDGSTAGPFDLVVDALGTRSALAPMAGADLPYGALWASLDWPPGGAFDPAALEQRYRAASVMAGVLPVGTPPHAPAPMLAFFWSLRADRLNSWTDTPLDAWKDDVRAIWPATEALLSQISGHGDVTFARYAHKTVTKPVAPALIHIGDAWHSASPQLGQGANMALLDAYALSVAMERCETVQEALRETLRLRRAHVKLYQVITYLFTPIYQSDSRLLPILRDRIMGPLSKLWPMPPILAGLVSGLIGRPLQRLDLIED